MRFVQNVQTFLFYVFLIENFRISTGVMFALRNKCQRTTDHENIQTCGEKSLMRYCDRFFLLKV